MGNPLRTYWPLKLAKVQKALAANNFSAYLANGPQDAKRVVMKEMLPGIAPKTASRGGFHDTAGHRDFGGDQARSRHPS